MASPNDKIEVEVIDFFNLSSWEDKNKNNKKEEVKKAPLPNKPIASSINPTIPPEIKKKVLISPPIKKNKNITLNDVNIIFPTNVVFIGRTGSGKTVFMKKIIKKFRSKFDYIYVFCPTVNISDDYDFIKNKKRKFAKFNKKAINGILEYQRRTNKRYHGLIIIDDMLSKENMNNNELLNTLYTTGRHFGISTFLVTQLATRISTTIRENSSYAFCTYFQRIECLFEMSSGFDNVATFRKYMKDNLVDYNIVMMHNDPKNKTNDRTVVIKNPL